MFDMHGETVCYNEKDETAVIIDQTSLPGEIVTLELWEKEEMYDAIKRLAVRGAPAIGGCRFWPHATKRQTKKRLLSIFSKILNISPPRALPR